MRSILVRVGLAGCLIAGVGLTAVLSPATAGTDENPRLAAYTAAAGEHGVPVDVLLAVSYLESRWDTNGGTPSSTGGFGPMHLTDVATATAGPDLGFHGAEDRRGDDARGSRAVEPGDAAATSGAAGQTLGQAAKLTGLPGDRLRADPAANIEGGAALLAEYQRGLGAPIGGATDPGQWYGAVARYSQSAEESGAAAFADEVFSLLGTGTSRVTDDGHALTLAARKVTPDRSALSRLNLRKANRPGAPGPEAPECPRSVSCEWIPAAYQLLGDGTDPTSYGNHDKSDRPRRQQISYIVIHDTEGSYQGTVNLVQDPEWVSWHYTIRSADGHIAQHVRNKDVAWHAGNWFVNAKAIGIEHEGFAAQGTWYTEAMYRSSAKLVRHLARQYNVPLDRAHIIGHDNVPGITPERIRAMHWDPGPYWDWEHYFELLGAPLRPTGGPTAGMVTIKPDFATNQPAFTGCTASGAACPARGSSAVILRSAPSDDAPLLVDVGLRPAGTPATMHISDHGARASSGQQYAVAERQGDWTAIWYLGQKGWFRNPPSAPAAVGATGLLVTPKAGRATVPVYGRAYPEAAAYPEGVPVQAIVPLQYTFAAGQRYTVGQLMRSEYYRSVSFDGSTPGDWTVVRGDTVYAQIQFGHRVMYVNLADVDLVPSWR